MQLQNSLLTKFVFWQYSIILINISPFFQSMHWIKFAIYRHPFINIQSNFGIGIS